jgi:hypothetical protein
MTIETAKDVLRDALEMHGRHEEPTPREVLGISIRLTCAQQGLPRPDLDHWPPYDRAAEYFRELSEQED